MLKELKNRDVLRDILNQRTSYFSKFLSVKHKKVEGSSQKCFLIVPASVSKSAVIRNRIRRRARAVLAGRTGGSKLASLAIFFKKGSEGLSFDQLKDELEAAIKNIK